MEIQLVHTTGSPSRQDSDSDCYDKKKKPLKSSTSEMALHRKQSRRTKKQMSERQRRKRMNTSMDKLGYLVYGKTFQDGLKVDKATLLKDAGEALVNMRDDYNRGYETAMASTNEFLGTVRGVPPEVKEELLRHLTVHLRTQHMHRALASAPLNPDLQEEGEGEGEEDSHSDSYSPQPVRASSPLDLPGTRHEDSVDGIAAIPPHPHPRPLSHSFPSTPLPASEVRSPQAPYTAVTPTVKEEPTHSFAGARAAGRQGCGSSQATTPGMTDLKPAESPVGPGVRATPSSAPVPRAAPACRRALVETVPPSAASLYTDVIKSGPATPPFAHHLPARSPAGSSLAQPRSVLEPATPGKELPPRGPYNHLPFPFYAYPCSSASPCTSTPKIAPYVTPFAPQEPLYLGSTPSSLLYSAPTSSSSKPSDRSSLPTPKGPLHLHTPASAPFPASRYQGGSARSVAEDSGYLSPVMPSPHTATPVLNAVAQYGGVKKRYLRDMMHVHGAESDEENDREVERVFSLGSRGGKFESDSSS